MKNATDRISRRTALAGMGAGFAMPFVWCRGGRAAPSETVQHASFGASGMAGADIGSLSESPHFQLVAVADVDARNLARIKEQHKGVRVYQDWRVLLDKEKKLDSANISTPDHMHGPITMRAMKQGLNVYTQKPLAQTIHEARQLTIVAREKGLVTQMGIQIHSHKVHQTIKAVIQAGTIGKVKEVHSWSGKHWGDTSPVPKRHDVPPKEFAWDLWLGVAAKRPFLAGYYHPGEWRKRLDFGTGTFGDMGCHILDPVYMSLALTAPRSITSVGGSAGADNWGLDSQVKYVFPATSHTDGELTLTWYDGDARPPESIAAKISPRRFSDQGSIYLGTKGVLYTPYIDDPILLPESQFQGVKLPDAPSANHYTQFVDACVGKGKTWAPFDYSGPLTGTVLLGCLATRFPKMKLEWDAHAHKVTNVPEANAFVRRHYRHGWEVEGL